MRRAVALFVEDKDYLLANSRWLYESWRHIQSDDTDLVFMGPKLALEKLPSGVVKIIQRPATDDAGWLDYGYVNSVVCVGDRSASVLDDYDVILRSDVDTFLTPALRPPPLTNILTSIVGTRMNSSPSSSSTKVPMMKSIRAA